MRKRALAVVPAALALLVGLPGTASAAGPVADIDMGTAQILGITPVASASGDTAVLHFRYRCSGAPSAAVWASVKQLDDPTATADWDFDSHGTSGQSAAWYDSHVEVPCDTAAATPRTRTAKVTVRRADYSEYGGPAWDRLVRGTGYVQLCVTVGGPEDAEPVGFAAHYEWVPVTAR